MPNRPTHRRRDSTVELSRVVVGGVYRIRNQLTTTADGFGRQFGNLTCYNILINLVSYVENLSCRWCDRLITFSTMKSLCRLLVINLNSLNVSTAQKIVKLVTTADGCVHNADMTQLDFVVGKFVQTRRDCRKL